MSLPLVAPRGSSSRAAPREGRGLRFDSRAVPAKAAGVPLRYLTVDFNSFFASVEQQERPELRGRPVAVVPVVAETTGCIAVSLEAKAAGLKRNVRVAEARRLCPEIEIVEARPETYIAYHRRLIEVIESCLHVVKVQSIDEVTCALTARFAPREEALAVAGRIKAAIRDRVGPALRCSIGLAPNWLLAKVASDLQKPDGLVALDDADIPARLLALEPEDICGIGSNLGRRLRAQGIDTVAKLYATPLAQMRGIWGGVVGERMFRLLHGEDLPFLTEESSSLGHGHVLPPKLRHPEAALAVLHRLLQKAAMRLRHGGRHASGLQVSVEYTDGAAWSEHVRLTETRDTRELTQALNGLWAKRPRDRPARAPLRLGVQLTGLIESGLHTPDLFAQEKERAHDRLYAAVDRLNRVLGKNTVYFGGAHGATRHAPMRIAFTRIPEPEVEEIDRSCRGRLRPSPPSPRPEPEAW
jgi:DNA polymerase-4